MTDSVKSKKITLITTLKPKSQDQFNKVRFFKKLFSFSKKESIELEVLIENSLHGKIYIGKQENTPLQAIITSANFTRSGLVTSNEWGVIIGDKTEIRKIEAGVKSRVSLEPITDVRLKEFIKEVDAAPSHDDKSECKLNLAKNLSLSANPKNLADSQTYWLKPIGVSGGMVSKETLFDMLVRNLHFSTKKPNGVKRNHILICYAVGRKNILSVYKVTSGILETKIKDDRWPYFVEGENLTPHFGSVWTEHNITISNQLHEFLQLGQYNATPSGKNSYGSLMRGADKLKLTPEFGRYITNKLILIDNQIASENV